MHIPEYLLLAGVTFGLGSEMRSAVLHYYERVIIIVTIYVC